MSDPIRAEDVLHLAYDYWENHPRDAPGPATHHLLADLLAAGSEAGVVILPDGTLRGLRFHHEITADERYYEGDPNELGVCYRLTEPGVGT